MALREELKGALVRHAKRYPGLRGSREWIKPGRMAARLRVLLASPPGRKSIGRAQHLPDA